MAIDKKTNPEKSIKVSNFLKDSMEKLKRIPNYSGIRAHVRSIAVIDRLLIGGGEKI